MVLCIPEEPRFTTTSEQEVWQRLAADLGDDAVLLANLRLTDERKDHEADLVVLLPGVGIVVLEVKGGAVRYDGGWVTQRHGKDVRIDPVAQAREVKYAIRDFVGRDPRWGSRGHVAWAHGVVTPYAAFPGDVEVPELPRWALHDRDDLGDLAERLVANARRMSHGRRAPTAEDVDAVVEVLTAPVRMTHDLEAEASEREAEATSRLTQEQAMVLSVSRLLHRVEVRGGAGSGKTVLALQQARELTRGRHGRRPQRVAVLCYSIGLAEFLKRQVAGWSRRERPAFVGTFHELGRHWGAPDGDRTDSDFWEVGLPRLMSDLVRDVPDGQRYDAVVVDEAQDFADAWWQPVLGALRDEEEGGLYVYSDENQRIFARFGRPPVQLVPLVLDHNLRNTKQIHESFGPLAPSRMYSRGGEGPAVRFVAADPEEALGVADDEVEALLDAGWAPSSVCLLTTGHRHPVQQEQAERHGQLGYWRSFWDGEDVFYGHVLGSKGLERRAVVLCINEDGTRDRARERLYVGMSRATDQLVVVGDPEVVRRAGGDAVARGLGIPC